MDYGNDDNESWQWQSEDYYLEKDTRFGDISRCLWDGVDENEGDLSYMFEEATPIKACGDLAYNVSHTGKNVNKDNGEYTDSHSHVKRRRMLHFSPHDSDSFLCNEKMPSTFAKSKDTEDAVVEVVPEILNWDTRYAGGRSASSSGVLDESSQAWHPNCFSQGGEMHFTSDDMNASGVFDEQIDISEFCNIPQQMDTEAIQTCSTPPAKIVFKGRKSFMKTPPKLATSVAYPFALIKPCGVRGDVTLKDINQKILTPPPKSKNDEEDSPSIYPTSAFSGKPVVVKTKIRTEGGKGSITIMRTKG